MNFKVMKKIAALVVVIFVFGACDDDFSTIGGGIIDNPTDVEVREVEVNAYNKKINAVQTNNLGNHLLGAHNHPVYGLTEASVLTQLSLSSSDPQFVDGAQLDSVVLNLPYFSSEVETAEDGSVVYKLDSVYGSSPFKLSIYESNYYLADYDPSTDFQNRQKYYSDQQEVFEQNLVDGPIYENDSFRPSPAAVVYYQENSAGENDTIVAAPAMRIQLPVNFFQQKIIAKEGTSVLANNSNFKNYFRGLFMKAEAVDGEGNMILFNFMNEEAGITLYYSAETDETNEDGETIIDHGSYELNFGNNIVNTFEGEYPEDIRQEIEGSDPQTGEDRLYLRGMEGSMAVIDLFSTPEELEELRNNNWLINEANLKIYVDQNAMQGVNEPERLYLYDLKNNQVLADYSFSANFIGDQNTQDPLNSLTNFSERLEKDEDENGVSYTVRLTQHISNILKKDSTNVKLGLVVTQNINQTGLSALKNPGEDVSRVPAMSVISPEGTVLYGDEAANEEKRLKLRIYYTDLD